MGGAAAHEASIAANQRRGRGPRLILVCEDDPDIARLIKHDAGQGRFRHRHGLQRRGRPWSMLEQQHYAAMTVDLKPSRTRTASALIRALRTRLRTRDLPIVVVSAWAEEGKIEFNNQALACRTGSKSPSMKTSWCWACAAPSPGMPPKTSRASCTSRTTWTSSASRPPSPRTLPPSSSPATLQEARSNGCTASHFDLVLLDLNAQGRLGLGPADTTSRRSSRRRRWWCFPRSRQPGPRPHAPRPCWSRPRPPTRNCWRP
jgi:CheY-like chemotaxis protein